MPKPTLDDACIAYREASSAFNIAHKALADASHELLMSKISQIEDVNRVLPHN